MFGGGLARGLIKKAIAAGVVAGAALVAIFALGAAVFFGLCLIVVPLAAAGITFLIFALIAAVVAMIFLVRQDDDEEDLEDAGIGQRAFALFRERPILGTVAALAGGWIFLRNPALATMVAAAFTEKSHGRSRR